MATQWTKEQNDVIQFRDCNILVSAAAGSGKTAVLVERILSMLMDETHPLDIDRLLIVTFTNAAAGEMKERIRMAIDKKLEEDLKPEVEEHLQKQSALLGNAQISTIHSFCQFVIRNYFHTIDLDPEFHITDDGERTLLMEDVMEQLLEESYKEGREAFLHMAENLAYGKNDLKIAEEIRRIYEFSMSFPEPLQWLRKMQQDCEIQKEEELLNLPWIGLMLEQCDRLLRDIEEQAQYAMHIVNDADGPHMYGPMIEKDQEDIRFLLEQKDYKSLRAAYAGLPKAMTMSRKKDDSVSESKKEQVKKIRKKYRDQLKTMGSDFFTQTTEEILQQMERQKPVLTELLELVIQFSERFEQEKRRKNLCDFHDLEHLALKILDKEEVRETLADHFQEILIDEYQDSNMVQEMILRSISREKRDIYNMFMVGDVKQSIYRFRLARPELFMEKFDTYSTKEGEKRRIDLHKNFRSRRQVLDSVNDIFEKIMCKDLGNVSYDEEARLNVGASFEPGADETSFQSEVLMLDTDADDETEDSKELEARMVGTRILELLKTQKVWDKETKCYRNARFGDIVILLRSKTGWFEAFVQTLKQMGIPALAGSQTGYFSASEVQIILSLLKSIDNPCQDIPLAGVLYSPIGKMAGVDLAALRCRDKNKPFYRICMESDDERLRTFFEMLNRFRKMAVYMPMQELLREIYEETGYLDYAAAMPGGEQRKANLDMLIEKAVEFEKGSYHGLYHFVRYIESLKKYEIDFGEADILAGNTDMVQIMSIHKSKGLEFPIVFVSGMGKNFNQTDLRERCIMHADYGIAIDEIDAAQRTKRKTLCKNVLKMQLHNDTLGEELRVLYVALTRAKEKLIMTGVIKEMDEALDKFALKLPGKIMSYAERSAATCYWDWVMPVVMQMPEKGSIALKTYTISDLIMEEKEKQSGAQEKKQLWKMLSPESLVDAQAREILEKNLEYSYPYAASVQLPSKISVSELKHMSYQEIMEEAVPLVKEHTLDPVIPAFLKGEKKIAGAAKGTIYHKLMECMDFSKKPDTELIRLQKEGIFSQEEALVISTQKIQTFLDSELGKRMMYAQKKGLLHREQPFVLQMEAGQIRDEWKGDEGILIQGIIDAYFEENGQLILVDYKTDKVNFEEASSLYEKYRVQLDCYRTALERLTGKKVREQKIYSFTLNCEITG